MNVGFVVGTLGRGGAERQLIYMLHALKTEGINSRVLCLTRGEANEEPIRDLGIDVEWVGSSDFRLFRLMKIAENVRRRRVDILQSSHFYTNIYAAAAARLTGAKSIGAIRSDLVSEIAANKVFGKWQLNSPQHLIANSALAVKRAVDKGIRPERIDFVQNVVDSAPDAERREKLSDEINLLFVGRLVKVKRPELFIELAKRLITDFPGKRLNFRMAGGGPLFGQLQELAAIHGLPPGQFSLLGETADMTEIYKSSDILVVTSAFEGTPNVVLEAMSHQIPVVATRVGGIPDILSDKCGILVDPDNFEELAVATASLISNPGMRNRLGTGGRAYVSESHSIEYLRKRLPAIYLKLLNGRRIND